MMYVDLLVSNDMQTPRETRSPGIDHCFLSPPHWSLFPMTRSRPIAPECANVLDHYSFIIKFLHDQMQE
jgi:hypothetical protein